LLQGVHDESPATLYVPALQLLQLAEPADEYVPGWHSKTPTPVLAVPT